MKNVLESLKERGLIDALAGEEIEKILARPARVYIGFDPTADSLHLGNFMGMMVLAWFQRCGHTPFILLGGATGRIGDPSGKSKERPLLEDAVLKRNVEAIRTNFSSVLDFSGRLPMPQFVNNDTWFSSFSFIDFLRDVGKHFRIGTMLSKDSVRSRVNSEEGMSFTEFSYQLLQSYDFYHLFTKEDVVLQAGGSDQWGNITAGIEFVRKVTGKGVYGLTFPLLTRSDGKKFGKSEEGAIWLSAEKLSPYQFYQYLVAIPDADVINLLKKLTFLDLAEVREWELAMQSSTYVPNSAQKKLAEEVTRLVHGEEGLALALRITEGLAPGEVKQLSAEVIEEIARDLPPLELSASAVVSAKFVEVLLLAGLVSSKGEASRLIQNRGGYLNQEQVEDLQRIIVADDLVGGRFLLLGAGKKKKALIRIKEM